MKHALLYLCIFGIGYFALTDSLLQSTKIDCHSFNIEAACQELAKK